MVLDVNPLYFLFSWPIEKNNANSYIIFNKFI